MKKSKILLAILILFLFVIGLTVASVGFGYYLHINPQENWVKIFTDIIPEKRWIVATFIGICGFVTAILPISLLFYKKINK